MRPSASCLRRRKMVRLKFLLRAMAALSRSAVCRRVFQETMSRQRRSREISFYIRCKAMWAQNSRETLRTQLLAREQDASAERTRTLQAELNAIGKRLPELDKLIQSAYEDKVLGRIPVSVCVNLLNQYEAERREKQERYKELTGQLAASRETESSVDAWLDMMQDYAQLEELDRPTLVRLIQKIEISERYPVDDHEERDIHIYYNFVGYIET